MTRATIAVIAGGRNSEHDVSLASAAGVRRALADDYRVLDVRIGRDGGWSLGGRHRLTASEAVEAIAETDVAFPVLHGVNGEDGTIAGFLETIGVPYVGSGVVAGAIAMDKRATKLLAATIGVRTAREVPVADALGAGALPVVVKPVTGGSSHGVSIARTPEEVQRALRDAAARGDRVLLEPLIVGREIDVAVLEEVDGSLTVAPILEIPREPGSLFDVAGKYGGDAGFLVPAPLSPAELDAVSESAMAVFRALGCRGIARVDFFLDADGFLLNEVNTMPGMTEHSQVPAMAAAAGMSYADLVRSLVEVARATRGDAPRDAAMRGESAA